MAALSRIFSPRRKMLVPARKTNHGAQKCVIHRVKKIPGLGPPAGNPEKTRTWSMAISTMTAPRRISTEAMRCAGGISEVEPLFSVLDFPEPADTFSVIRMPRTKDGRMEPPIVSLVDVRALRKSAAGLLLRPAA